MPVKGLVDAFLLAIAIVAGGASFRLCAATDGDFNFGADLTFLVVPFLERCPTISLFPALQLLHLPHHLFFTKQCASQL